MGLRTGTDWRREELKEERGWAQGSWGKDHQKKRGRRKREEPVEGRAYGRGRGGAPVRETAEGGATGMRRGYRS